MTARAFSLAVLVAACLAGPAAAQPPPASPPDAFASFSAFCLEAKPGSPTALARADAAGWARIPEEMLAAELAAIKEIKMRDIGLRVMVIDRTFVMLMVGTGDMPLDGSESLQMNLCGFVSYSTQGAAVRQRMQAFAGSPPMQIEDDEMQGFSMWMYIQDRNGRRDFLGENDFMKLSRALKDGELNMLLAGEETGMTMMMHLKPVSGYAN
ncbi:MAG TPA: hypothetical protein VEA44_01705 [Caulobacter sp.]|nr:hypothetical protein [Caulobacter sp.]